MLLDIRVPAGYPEIPIVRSLSLGIVNSLIVIFQVGCAYCHRANQNIAKFFPFGSKQQKKFTTSRGQSVSFHNLFLRQNLEDIVYNRNLFVVYCNNADVSYRLPRYSLE